MTRRLLQSVLAVTVGFFVVQAGHFAVGFVVGFAHVAVIIPFTDRFSETVLAGVLKNHIVFFCPFLIGCQAFTFLGGLVAARLAKSHEIPHGVILGLALLVHALLLSTSLPLWVDLAKDLTLLPLSFLGGYVIWRRRTRESGLTLQST